MELEVASFQDPKSSSPTPAAPQAEGGMESAEFGDFDVNQVEEIELGRPEVLWDLDTPEQYEALCRRLNADDS